MKSFLTVFISLVSLAVLIKRTIQVPTADKSRIVGGTLITIDKVPFYVQVLSEGELFCGGSLISRRTVLTAGHCLEDIDDPTELQVITGSARLEKGTITKVKSILRHPNYDTGTFLSCDLGLIFLKKPVKLSKTTKVVTLTQQPPYAGMRILIVGLGLTKENNTIFPKDLQQITLPVAKMDTCKKFIAGFKSRFQDGTQFCIGADTKKPQDSCPGDSGGPAIYNKIQYGIVSWGRGCARPNYYGIYTNVSLFYNWIQNNKK